MFDSSKKSSFRARQQSGSCQTARGGDVVAVQEHHTHVAGNLFLASRMPKTRPVTSR